MKTHEQFHMILNRCIECCEQTIDDCEDFSTICAGTDPLDCVEEHTEWVESLKSCMNAARVCILGCQGELKTTLSVKAAAINECITACQKVMKTCENALKACETDKEICMTMIRECIRACNECAELCQAVIKG